MKIEKISKIVLIGLIVLSIVLFALFFFVGWNDETEYIGDKNVPMLTDTILIYMYVLIGISSLLVFGTAIYTMIVNKDKGLMVVVGATIGTAAVYNALYYALYYGVEMQNYTSDSDLKAISDSACASAYMYMIYALFAVAVIAVAVSMSGVLTRSAIKK